MATACLLGVPAERIVYGDAVERTYWSLVTNKALEMETIRRDNQAIANAKQIAEVLRRMFGRH